MNGGIRMDQQILEETKQEAQNLISENRLSEALPLIRQLAHWGDLNSQKELIEIYYNHKYGFERNLPAAFEYARLAAMNQDTDAMVLLAQLLMEGKGCRKDLQTALYFLNKAADAGNVHALDELSMIYLKGIDEPRDLSMASRLIEKAADLLRDHPEDTESYRKLNDQVKSHQQLIEKYSRRFS